MKLILTSIAAATLLAAIGTAQVPRYTVTDLGTLSGGNYSYTSVVTNSSFVIGRANAADGTYHAVLWQKGSMIDLGTPGLKGKNSIGWGVNESGQAVGQAETSTLDPNGEDFCGFKAIGLPSLFTTCVPFLWQSGVMTPLPTLGGGNGVANAINNRGSIAGSAENTTPDPNCPAPQVLQFKPVIWENGKIHELPTFPGDADGLAFGINDNGQVVGASGRCAAFDPIGNTDLLAVHALLWQNGTVTDLGNLGGEIGNSAAGINSKGQVVGSSDLRGDQTFHAFLWTQATGIQDLGAFPGDVNSVALGINERGEVVGISLDANFTPRAVLWENGVPIDLNALIPAKSGLTLQLAESINSRGEIIGFGQTSAGDTHAYLATPVRVTTASAGPKNITVIGREIVLDGTASISADGKPLTYQWSIPQGSPSAGILHGNTATPTIQFSPLRGVYTFQLTATDSTGTSATDTATVNFQGN